MNGPPLLALQLLDSELDQIEQRRKRLPQRAPLADATTAHAGWRSERHRLEAIVAEAYDAIERSETASADIQKKKARLDAQLKTVIAPREAEALMHEIDGLLARRNELDDAELLVMETQAEAEKALSALAEVEPPLLASLAQAQAALDEALLGLGAEEADIRARRGEVDASLTDDDRSLYGAMRVRHGGVGFARLDRHTCSACHVDLSQVEFERVMAAPPDELPDCPHCGRHLVV